MKYVRLVFTEEVEAVDPDFFKKLDESMLYDEDRTVGSLGRCLSDIDYYDRFPTVHHLNRYLIETDRKPDIRLVFLAINHIMKRSGHFLSDIPSKDGLPDFGALFRNLTLHSEEAGLRMDVTDVDSLCAVMSDTHMDVKTKKAELKKIFRHDDGCTTAVTGLLAGASVSLNRMFPESDSDSKISLKARTLEEVSGFENDWTGRIYDCLESMQELYDCATLIGQLKGFDTLSDMKISSYEQHKTDLRTLKEMIKEHVPERYNSIFRGKECLYSRYTGRGKRRITCEQFCNGCLNAIKGTYAECDGRYATIISRMKNGDILPKQKVTDNCLIPYSLNELELKRILTNVSRFYPFLNGTDGTGMTLSERILAVAGFRIPYFVGPLDTRSEHSWCIRRSYEHVMPWNIDRVIDMDATAASFMDVRIGDCPYCPNEKVLPKNSLIYSYYILYDILNTVTLNGVRLSADLKEQVVRNLFENRSSSVTYDDLRGFLRSRVPIDDDVHIAGSMFPIPNPLRSFHVLKEVLGAKIDDHDLCEGIIRICTVFPDRSSSVNMLRREYGSRLSEQEINALGTVRFRGWGRFSAAFLCGPSENASGGDEKISIMQMLRDGQLNLSEILSANQSKAKREVRDVPEIREEVSRIRSPMVKRTLFRMIAVTEDIVKHMGCPPSKIFIEASGIKGGSEQETRKSDLLSLYRKHAEDEEWADMLESMNDGDLRNKSLYLYFTQLGRCMYCGRRLNVDSKLRIECADRDHIHPRSVTADDSVRDNLVLTCRTCNESKGDRYPLDPRIISDMRPMWEKLHDRGYISDEKFFRLICSRPLGDGVFHPRQIYETGSTIKTAIKILESRFGDVSEVVPVSCENVSKLRSVNGFIKCRTVNDRHHAEDAYLCILAGSAPGKGADRSFSMTDEERRCMRCTDVRYTGFPCMVRGKLFRDNLYPAGAGHIPRKRGMDTEKYGGYGNAIKEYCSLLEYRVLKHTVHAIEPVNMCAGIDPDDADALARYHSEVLGREVKVLIPCIKIGSVLEWGGMRVTLKGFGTTNMLVTPAEQFVLPHELRDYCRRLYNYDTDAKKGSLMKFSHYGINSDDNIALFQHVVGSLTQAPYAQVMSNTVKNLEAVRSAFMEADVKVQARMLNQILRITQCNSMYADLTEIGGLANCGKTMLNRRLPPADRTPVFLIHQSPSGLSETRVPLNTINVFRTGTCKSDGTTV